MTIEEALDILENGNWFSYVDNNAPQSTVSKVAEAINTLARNIRITHGHINREKWEPCLNCQDIEKLSKHIKCWPSYCPVCGRPLTDEAWDELEKRLRG